MGQFIAYSIGVFLIVILLLVIILLVAKKYLSPSGNVNIEINGDRTISVAQGSSLMATLNENGVFLPSACGGKASCGQCKVQVLEGGGEILDSEKPHFSRKEIKAGWRLGCQCKVKGDLKIHVDESILGVKEYECTVISNKNVATFIKEFKVQLPAGAHMDFLPGSYAQIKIPAFDCIDYDKDFDKSLIGDEYLPSWEKFGLFPLKCKNPEPTIRAYSMANYPAEGDVFMLTVRIATPPFKPDRSGFMEVNPGIASSYIFSLKPGDKVTMSGPYGDFHPHFDSKREMIWVGGGAGMAPLRAQIMHMTKTLHTKDREMHYFYGARALNEVFYLDDFLGLEKEYPNFHFHLALDRPDPAADAAGVKYTPGFVHNVMFETYLKDHEAPEDIEYYMCGPGPMSKAVVSMLDSLGVEPEKYQMLVSQIASLIEGEDDQIAMMSNVAAAIHQEMKFWWTGFYRVVGDELLLGPFQGPVACMHIPFGRGVCGTAWQRQQTVVVPDVDQFPGHIACSSQSRSEIVVPVFSPEGKVTAVLDIDSENLATFDDVDRQYLEQICQMI